MGGIGEHDPVVRQKICSGLEPLGILLDISSNGSNLLTINASKCAYRKYHPARTPLKSARFRNQAIRR